MVILNFRIHRSLFIAVLLNFCISSGAHALSIVYPGEGLKTVVSQAGEEVKKVLDADNDASRALKGVVGLVDPNNMGM